MALFRRPLHQQSPPISFRSCPSCEELLSNSSGRVTSQSPRGQVRPQREKMVRGRQSSRCLSVTPRDLTIVARRMMGNLIAGRDGSEVRAICCRPAHASRNARYGFRGGRIVSATRQRKIQWPNAWSSICREAIPQASLWFARGQGGTSPEEWGDVSNLTACNWFAALADYEQGQSETMHGQVEDEMSKSSVDSVHGVVRAASGDQSQNPVS